MTDDNELKINYFDDSNKKIFINLTHHSFFNLKGEGEGNINDHVLIINANHCIPINAGLIPTGNIVEVANGC